GGAAPAPAPAAPGGALPGGSPHAAEAAPSHGAPPAEALGAPPANVRSTPAPAPSGFPFFDDGGRGPAGPAPVPAASDGTNHTLVVPSGGVAQDGLPYGGVPYGGGEGPAYPRPTH